jgi:hypothetical protein
MVKRIEKLTDEHRATFDEWTRKWIDVGHKVDCLSAQEWDLTGDAVLRAYRFSGLDRPAVLVRVPSPFAGAVAVSVALEVIKERRAGVGAGVRDGVGAGVRAGVEDGVWAGVGAGVEDGVEAGVEAGVWAGVRDGVWAGVGAGVRAGVGAGYPDWLHKPIRDGIANAPNVWHGQYRGGNLWASWEAWASWFRDIGGLELDGDLWERLQCSIDLTTAGFSWWYNGFAIVSDRPTVLHVQPSGGGRWEMHCETGPAVAWADGWSLHFWHGTRVPAWVIESPTVERIQAEANTEIRRCAIERLGWDTYLDALGVTPVSVEPDPGNSPHMLRLFEVPDSAQLYGERVRLLLMQNASRDRDGTRRTFAETTPTSCRTAIEAAAWQFRLSADEYKKLARAT